MSTVGSGSLLSSPAAAPAPAVEDTSSSWAPHGAALTAFVVGINLLMIALIFFFFWRFFSGKRGDDSGSDGADDDGSLPVASPWASRRRRREAPRAKAKPLDDVASALPVYVYSAGADKGEEGGTKAPECAVCIVELRDGDSARRLPRCGHRFHADCVGAWLRLHATCPLCRATVVAPKAAAAAGGEARNGGKGGGGGDVGADSAV